MKIPLGLSDHRRSIANQPSIQLLNRYFESDPALVDDQVSLLARPGLRKLFTAGSGPIRPEVYCQPGSFDDAAFAASANTLYRIDITGNPASIGTITGASSNKAVSMASTAAIGSTPEYLFIADGTVLWLYTSEGFATGTLTATGAPVNNDVVVVGTMYYKFTTGSVDTGTPAGTVGSPWLVARTGTTATDLASLFAAINDTGVAGTTYSTLLTINLAAAAATLTATTIKVRALAVGSAGNGVATTETSANLSWTGTTLSGGGSASFTQVATPDDVAVISVGYIGSHVIVVPGQDQGINGRFYWIEPGETTIDPLNFATAERSPDPIFQVKVFADKFLLPGKVTTETWFLSGDPDAPMQRLQSVVFDRGAWPGTAVTVKESLVIVDQDGAVFQIAGGIKRLSTPGIEQRIRTAIALQAAS